MAGDEIPDTMFAPMYRSTCSTIEKLYWGRQYLTREFFDLMRERLQALHLFWSCAYRGRELIAGTFNLQKSGVLYGRYWGCFERSASSCTSTSATTRRSSIASRTESQRFEPGAGGEYKWLRGFDPALTRSIHYISNPDLRRAIGNF